MALIAKHCENKAIAKPRCCSGVSSTMASAAVGKKAASPKAIGTIASAISEEGGMAAVNLRVAEQYVTQFGKLAKESNTLILPTNAGDIAGFVGTVTTAMTHLNEKPKPE